MQQAHHDMSSLIAMAREGTRRSRQQLAENVLDLVISADGRLNDRERALTDQVLTRLVRDMELQVRQQLAAQLAHASSAPAGLLELLARDDISVAGPILKHSHLLKETTLIEIAKLRIREHQICIAMREGISAQLSDVLIENSVSPDVLETLIRNQKATLSESAKSYLVAESRRFDQFQEPLLSRADLPANLANQMFWWVSAQLRQKILRDFDIAEHELDPLLETSTGDVLKAYENERQSNIENSAIRLARAIDEEGQLGPEIIINMLRKQRIPAFCAALSNMAGVSFATVSRIVLDTDITPFAILCRAVKISEAHFSTMALLLQHERSSRRQSEAELRNILELFRDISSDQARSTLHYWHNESELQKAAKKLR